MRPPGGPAKGSGRRGVRGILCCAALLGLLLGIPGVLSAEVSPTPGMALLNPHVFLLGQGKAGLFHQGMTPAEVRRTATETYQGRTSESEEMVGEGATAQVLTVFLRENPKKPALRFVLENRRIHRIEVLSPKFQTRKGVRVGSTWKDLHRLYPKGTITLENGPRFLLPDDDLGCEFDPEASVNPARPAPGLRVVRLYLF